MQQNIDYNKFFADLNILNSLKVEEDLGSGYVRLKISEAERRQALQDIKSVEDIIIELLRNSRDAKAKNIYLATKRYGEKKRIIHIIDDGKGIPPKFHNLIFQSRVTSKLENGLKDKYGFHGRGMALFSIKLNVEKIDISFSNPGMGTCITTRIDLEKIPEKKDQSLMPEITKEDNGKLFLSGGINNIIKILMDFILNNRSINLYYGSPAQIISVMIDNFKNLILTSSKEIGYTDQSKFKKAVKIDDFKQLNTFFLENEICITQMPFFASSPVILGEIIEKYFEMDISFRNLQRIFYNKMKVLNPINSFLTDNKTTVKKQELNYSTDDKSTSIKLFDENKLANRFKDEEINYIIKILKEEILKIGRKHFIELADDIEFKKYNNKFSFNVFLKQKD